MILSVAQLTASGRPVLQQGEVEVIMLDKVDLEFHPMGGLPGQQAEAYKRGYVILTNRRLIWVDAGPPPAGGQARAASLPLAAVVACSKKVQYGIKGSKVRVALDVYTDRQLQPVPASAFHSNLEVLALRCRGPAPDAFVSHMNEQVRQAVAADAAAAAAALPAATTAAAGTPPRPAAPLGAGTTTLSDAHMSPLRAGLQSRAGAEASGAGGPGAAPVPGGGPGGPGPGPGAGAATSADMPPDLAMLHSMVEMGFPRNRSARALMATRNQGVQEAIDFLLAFGGQPGMDEPWDAAPSPPPPPQYPSIMPYGSTGPSSGGPGGPTPYSQMLYGSPYGDAGATAGFSGSPGPAFPSHGGTQPWPGHQQSPYHHQPPYGSAPELRGAAEGPGPGAGAGAGRLAIGVAGIVQREQQKTAESGRAVEDAFRDLSALMSSAATMVALAEKFRGVLGMGDGAGGGAGPGGEDPLLMDADTQQQLIALGISSPVTRGTAGARYHIELSRQLADFLEVPLQRGGGLMSLPDVYCLFNRARGTELVSPDDLLLAAKSFGAAGVAGLRLRPLASGVLVIQGPQHSEERVCAKIADLTTPKSEPQHQQSSPPQPGGCPAGPLPPSAPPLGPGLTAGDVALALGGISVAIATEHLLTAEARGVVCRDDGPEGLRFYRNFFRQDRLDASALGG